MRIRFDLPAGPALAAAGLILSTALASCASTGADRSVGEPTPLAIKAVGRSDGENGRTDDEARRLAGVQGVWRRGDVLTVDTDEGIQYRFVDAGVCEGFYTCRRWIFRGSVETVAQIPDKHSVGYWLIEFEHGEGGYWLAIGTKSGSSTTLLTGPTVSPDRRRWATGECNDESGSGLQIFETGEFGQITLAADAGDADCCDILGWEGAALKVRSCELEPGKAFNDRLVRQPDGRWVGARIRLERPKSP